MSNVIYIAGCFEEDDEGPDLGGRAAYSAAKAQYERDGKNWNSLTRLQKLPLYRQALALALSAQEVK